MATRIFPALAAKEYLPLTILPASGATAGSSGVKMMSPGGIGFPSQVTVPETVYVRGPGEPHPARRARSRAGTRRSRAPNSIVIRGFSAVTAPQGTEGHRVDVVDHEAHGTV